MNRFRQWVKKNQGLAGALAVVAIIGCVVFWIRRGRTDYATTSVPLAWFYDVGSGKLFTAPGDQLPPIEAPWPGAKPGAPTGVRAYIFACGNCADRKGRFLGYLSTVRPEMREAVQTARSRTGQATPEQMQADAVAIGTGELVSAPPGTDWVLRNSPQGFQITGASENRCPPGTDFMPCAPSMIPAENGEPGTSANWPQPVDIVVTPPAADTDEPDATTAPAEAPAETQPGAETQPEQGSEADSATEPAPVDGADAADEPAE